MPLTGPGVGLPLPQSLYPVNLLPNAPYTAGTNRFDLAAGDQLPIPAGEWLIDTGPYGMLQYFDPVMNAWRGFSSARMGPTRVVSDGFNLRVANMTGCPLAAVVTNGGSGYAAATTTCTASAGGSTWQPIVGGTVNTTVTITSGGANYTVPPLLFVPAPPSPGFSATMRCTISGGAINAVTVTNQGAGYATAPTVLVLPDPTDPNFSSITPAVLTTTLNNSGKVTGVICTNPGTPQSSAPTLSFGGAGSSAAATVVMLWTATGVSVGAGGTGVSANNEITSVGGITAASPAFTNPEYELTAWVPRKASMLDTVSGGAVTTTVAIYDGGLFTGTPGCLVLAQGITSQPTVTFTLGSTTTTVLMQKLK